MSSLFDQNQWYQIQARTLGGNMSMAAIQPGDISSTALVTFQDTNTSALIQRWQIWSTQGNYVLRSAANPNTFLSVKSNTTAESTTGGTRGVIRKASNAAGDSLWNISPFNNGYFFMNNVANGTKWQLFAKDAGNMAMTSNIVGQQVNQSFNFTKVAAINDDRYSSIKTPTIDPTATTLPGSGTPDSNDGSLSTQASIGIGVGVGLAALIAILAGTIFLLRRRKQKNASTLVNIEKAEQVESPFLQPPPAYGQLDSLAANTTTESAPIPSEIDGAQVQRPVQEMEADIAQPIEVQGSQAQAPVELSISRQDTEPQEIRPDHDMR